MTGGFEMGPFAIVVVEEEPEDVAEVVEGGIVPNGDVARLVGGVVT